MKQPGCIGLGALESNEMFWMAGVIDAFRELGGFGGFGGFHGFLWIWFINETRRMYLGAPGYT